MAKLDWDIKIRKAENGIMVAVGCRRFVFSDQSYIPFLEDLHRYLLDDVSIGKKYAPELFEKFEKDYSLPTPDYAGNTERCEPETFL